MLAYWIWFSRLQGLNGRQKLQLLEYFHSPEEIYRLDVRDVKRMSDLPDKARLSILNKDLTVASGIVKACKEKKIGVLAFTDSNFPNRLRLVDDPPMVLYYRGRVPAWGLQPVIGIVGTRRASAYGLRSAENIAAEIAACGGIVASGGAQGIDTEALKGALNQGQVTVSVMAGGLDRFYPKSNTQLFEKIMENGCLLSEYAPGEAFYKGNFLRRNRIISGISNAVLVVEAPKISGALSTARWAYRQGRDIFAVPGNIDVETCAGSNEIIGDMATPALSGWAVVSQYAHAYPGMVKRAAPVLMQMKESAKTLAQEPKKPALKEQSDKINVDKPIDSPYSVKENISLTDRERQIVALLTQEPVPVDIIVEKLQLPSGAVMTVLTKLAIKGVVKNHPGKRISLA